ncbi:hypothetical protein [Aureimonas sp. SK2]|uniref:hypothetical protein n=1 Tax=Aureimonas sp. SK2 TaxID=3015992 RepID=UPI002443CA43|nr:hypothetical protein [Aureimonas sp. SK2]
MTGMDMPAPTDVLAAAFMVGVLFLVRFALALRRIRSEPGATWQGGVEAWRDVTRPQSYGAAQEPNRRHAARQLYLGLFFLALSAILGMWLAGAALFGWPVPFARSAAL